MSQTRYRWMLFLVIILVASNVLLGYLLLQTGHHPIQKKRKGNDVSAWYAEVGLEQDQIDTFKILKEEYFNDMKPLWGDLRQLKDSLYQRLDKGIEDSISQNILLMISKKTLKPIQGLTSILQNCASSVLLHSKQGLTPSYQSSSTGPEEGVDYLLTF